MSSGEMESFWFEEYEVRFVGTPDDPEWVAKDVCDVLGINNPSQALSDFDDDEKGITEIDTLGGRQKVLTVTEPGLYKLVTRSQKPNAKGFSRWVFKEVLPSIRRTGSYSLRPTPGEYPQLLPLRVRRERLEIIELGMKLLSSLGGIDERTEMEISGLVKNIVLEERLKKPALPEGQSEQGRFEWPVSDRATFLGFHPARKQLINVGKAVASLYRERYGAEPPKREQFVDGTTRMVNCYSETDLDILDAAIRSVMTPPAQLPPSDDTDDIF